MSVGQSWRQGSRSAVVARRSDRRSPVGKRTRRAVPRRAARSSSTSSRGQGRRRTPTWPSTCSRSGSAARSSSRRSPRARRYFQAMRDGKVDVALEDWDNTRPGRAVVHQGQSPFASLGLERDHRRHRLVHPALSAQAVPAVQDVAGLEGQGRASSSLRSRARRGCSSAVIRPTSRRTSALIEALGLNLKHVVGRRRAGAGRALAASSTSRRSPCSSTGTTRST